ncbi:hypothetical protein BpHYR1_006598 [Brachionus plicatilis]|uniref:Uncharacterized protein n=1 Tax=Brachionus plicatilis TaxID=10195 RepID=A0A3M7RB90_BRAPC|nr:hypothetical protein BpHYR1_006598 [Brachionus plicatilis]
MVVLTSIQEAAHFILKNFRNIFRKFNKKHFYHKSKYHPNLQSSVTSLDLQISTISDFRVDYLHTINGKTNNVINPELIWIEPLHRSVEQQVVVVPVPKIDPVLTSTQPDEQALASLTTNLQRISEIDKQI